MVQACRTLSKAQRDTEIDSECAAVERLLLASYKRNPGAEPPEEFDVSEANNSSYFDTTSLHDLGVAVGVAEPERPRVSRDAASCQYAGFAFGMSLPVSLGPKQKPLVQIESAELTQLTLPNASSPTGSVEMTWPLVNTLYFEHGTVLRSSQPIEFLRDHLWLEANRPVEARQISPNRAELRLGLEPALGSIELHAEAACDRLTLQNGPTSPKPDEDDFRAIIAGSGVFPGREAEVTLHTEPGGAPILRWRAVDRLHWYLRILEESKEWVRVRSRLRNGVVFEGWLPRQGVAFPRGTWGYTPRERRRRVVNRATRERTDLLDANGKATGLVLAARVPVQAQRRNGPWLGVEIPGLLPMKQGTLFWIRETDLRPFY
jgi:hypothetical protein